MDTRSNISGFAFRVLIRGPFEMMPSGISPLFHSNSHSLEIESRQGHEDKIVQRLKSKL